MGEKIKNNVVNLVGEIANEFTYDHKVLGEKFYRANLKVDRISGVHDLLPIMVSDRAVDIARLSIGTRVKVFGEYRSYNQHTDIKAKLLLFVFVQDIEFAEDEEALNEIRLEGYICKQPTYRETPLGREISDVLIAVNRPYNKSDYIPCIAWGRNARFAGQLTIGSGVEVYGRIQSREFQKRVSETEVEQRIAYEVSVRRIELLEESTDEE